MTDFGPLIANPKTLLLGANSAGVESKVKVKLDTGSWAGAEELKVLVRFKSN